jgi:hypothetical protein
MDTTTSPSYSVPQRVAVQRSPWWERHPVGTGALGGLAWGILMRLWMRFISTDPEFSWSGTSYILGASLLAGLGLGLAYHLSRKARRGWWRVFGLPVILLGGGAGMIMLPGVVLGAVAFGRRDWPRRVRIALWIVAAGGTIALVLSLDDSPFGLVKMTVAMTTFALFHTIEMMATGVVFAPKAGI